METDIYPLVQRVKGERNYPGPPTGLAEPKFEDPTSTQSDDSGNNTGKGAACLPPS